VDEEPPGRHLRHRLLEVVLEDRERLAQLGGPDEPLRSGIEKVEPAKAARAAADDEGQQVIDEGAGAKLRPRGQARCDLAENGGVAHADADARAVGREADASRPPEAVDLLQSGRGPAQARHGGGVHGAKDRMASASTAIGLCADAQMARPSSGKCTLDEGRSSRSARRR